MKTRTLAIVATVALAFALPAAASAEWLGQEEWSRPEIVIPSVPAPEAPKVVALAPAAPAAAAPVIQVAPAKTVRFLPGVLVTRGAEAVAFYDWPTRRIYVSNVATDGTPLNAAQSAHLIAHEQCHSHQHLLVLELGLDATRNGPGNIQGGAWLDTDEAKAFAAMTNNRTASGASPWTLSRSTVDEDFAEVCSQYVTNPSNLKTVDPTGFAAFEASVR